MSVIEPIVKPTIAAKTLIRNMNILTCNSYKKVLIFEETFTTFIYAFSLLSRMEIPDISKINPLKQKLPDLADLNPLKPKKLPLHVAINACGIKKWQKTNPDDQDTAKKYAELLGRIMDMQQKLNFPIMTINLDPQAV